MKRTYHYWTNEEIEYLKNHYVNGKIDSLKVNLSNHSWISIRIKANSLKLKREKSSLYGKPLLEKTKVRMSEAKKGKKNPNFGKLRSEETKVKMSESHKGKYPSQKTRRKLSEAKTGEKHPNYGKHHSEETKKKISESHKGEKCCNWKGGISFAPYCSLFNEKFKESIRDEFNRECFICGLSEELSGKKLNIHHLNYNKNCLCDSSECYFVPLCDSCHGRTNFNRGFWEKLLTTSYKDSYMAEYFLDTPKRIFNFLRNEYTNANN